MAELGAIASIAGIAAAGAQLPMALFEFGSTVGSARSEVNQIATEISQFCAVLKQLHSTLTKAKARRYSISAIATTQDILKRCQEIFREIEDIVRPLQKSAGKSKEPPVDVVARVKWTFKRSKVQVLQKTLESSKNTLQLMLLVLDLAQKTASPRASTIEEQLEDEQEQAVIQGLITAHKCTVDQLKTLENEAEAQNAEQDDSIQEFRSSEAEVMQIRTGNIEGVTSDEGEQKRATESKRASVWVSNLIFNNSPLPTGFRRNTWGDTVSAPTIASQARYLVQAWTAQAPKITKDSNQDQKKNSGPAIEHSKEEHSDKSEPPLKPPVQLQNLAKLPDLFCVKAMHDYEADDRAALSFHKGDIIQVLGMLESGWWDGVINGVRGWFPCNYTFIIKPPHQDLETSHDEKDYEESDGDESGDDGESGDDEIDYEIYEGSDDEESDDFWVPQATPDGPLFHFNVQTGEASLEPPKKAEMKELNWPTNFWIPQVTADGRLFYLSTQTGESAMEPIEESPKTVTDVPSERADGTGNSGIDKRKISLKAQTALLDQRIRSLVTSVRSDAKI